MSNVKEHAVTCECISPSHVLIFRDISISREGRKKEKELLIFSQLTIPKGIINRIKLSFRIMFKLDIVPEYPWSDSYLGEEKIIELQQFLDRIG